MIVTELEEIRFDTPEAMMHILVSCTLCNKKCPRSVSVGRFSTLQVGCKNCNQISKIELFNWVTTIMRYYWGYSDDEITQVEDTMNKYQIGS